MILKEYKNPSFEVLETLKDELKTLPVKIVSNGNNIQIVSNIENTFECLAKMENNTRVFFTKEKVEFKDNCSCEHCNSKRNRKSVFLIRLNNQIKQVGSTCLKEYTSEKYFDELNNVLKIRENLDDLFLECIKKPKFISLEEVFEKVISFVLENPYDKDYIKINFNSLKIKKFENFSFVSFKEYFNKKEITNNFLETCKDILKNDFVSTKLLGYAIWMVYDYFENNDTQNSSEFFGEVGQKVKDFNYKIKSVKVVPIEGYTYNSVEFIYIIKFENLNSVLVYKGTNDNIKVGNVLKSFTVKGFKEYNSEKQTLIQRPKF